MKKEKAIVLFSNGLDSKLVVKLLQKAKFKVIAIYFILPFGSRYPDYKNAEKFLKKEKVRYQFIDCTKGELLKEYMSIIKKPKFSYGKGLNPCIDCKIFMLKKAKEIADKNKIEIIATGEVLNERPKSQTEKALKIIEKESKLKGKILRPLSAKVLEKTDYEKENPEIEKIFYEINGRQRKTQIELAKKFKIDYPTPAGGCLLCEPEFCKKVRPFLKKQISEMEIEITKVGRHFEDGKIILGKNKEENEKLQKIYTKYKKGNLIIPELPGPSALITNKKLGKKAKELIKRYSKKRQ